MRLKQIIYNIYKNIKRIFIKKIKTNGQEIIVIENVALDRFYNIFTNCLIVDSLEKIDKKDFNKIIIYFGSPDKKKLKKMTNLKWLQLSSAGLNGFDNRQLYANENIIITNAKKIYGIPISECVIGYILFLIKVGLSNCINKKHSIEFNKSKDFEDLDILICGLGDIGLNIVDRCYGMKCHKIVGVNRSSISNDKIDSIIKLSDVQECIGEFDVVINSLPSSSETFNFFNEATLSKMKQDSIFINVGRGDILDQKALQKLVLKKKLLGAVLDTTTPDPLPLLSSLRRTKRIVVTNHFSCLSENNKKRLEDYYYNQSIKYKNGEIN